MNKVMTAGMMSLLLTAGFSIRPVQAHDMAKSPAEQQKMKSEHLAKMTKDLNLTTDQQTAIGTAMDTKMQKMSDAMKEFDDTVRANLNPDQQTKYNAMQAKKEKEKK